MLDFESDMVNSDKTCKLRSELKKIKLSWNNSWKINTIRRFGFVDHSRYEKFMTFSQQPKTKTAIRVIYLINKMMLFGGSFLVDAIQFKW